MTRAAHKKSLSLSFVVTFHDLLSAMVFRMGCSFLINLGYFCLLESSFAVLNIPVYDYLSQGLLPSYNYQSQSGLSESLMDSNYAYYYDDQNPNIQSKLDELKALKAKLAALEGSLVSEPVYNLYPQKNNIEPKSYQPPKASTKYIPVVVKKKKKKQKVISITKGTFIAGGVQVFGKFKSLKACLKACGATPTCFAGDYDPWLGKCYFHSNVTACDSMQSHSKITHFKKVPCTVTDAPRGRIILGAHLFGTTVQKGIDNLPDCLKKCANSGPGISSVVPTQLTVTAVFGQIPTCYGINYDFATHQCYFITSNFPRLADAGRAMFTICPVTDDTDVRVPVDLAPNPTVVTIILCPIRTAP